MGTPLPSSKSVYPSQSGQYSPAPFAHAPFFCYPCSREFVDEIAWHSHMINSKAHRGAKGTITQPNTQGNIGPAHCSVCNRVFVNSEALASHIQYSESHLNKEKEMTQATVVKSSGETIAHKDDIPSEAAYCRVCNRVFVNSQALTTHIKHSETHKNQRNATSRIAKNIQDTTPKHGSPSKVSYHCRVCNRLFVSRNALGMHIMTSKEHEKRANTTIKGSTNDGEGTVLDKNDIPVKPAFCSTCNRFFVNDEALEMHIKDSSDHQSKITTVGGIANDHQGTVAPLNGTLPRLSIPPQTFALTAIEPATREMHLQQSTPGHSQSDESPNDGGVLLYTEEPWSRIPQHEWLETLGLLSRKCHSLEVLSRHGYRIGVYTQDEMDGLRKCLDCGGQQKKIESCAPTECLFHPCRPTQLYPGDPRNETDYACCGESGRGCTVKLSHNYAPLDPCTKYRFSSYARIPIHRHPKPGKYSAIALDCEMAGVTGGYSEVVRLCAVDYISGKVLIDSLVDPSERIIQWRSKYSGVTKAMLASAKASGQCLRGWQGARAELWKYMDEDTVLVGQSLHNDLWALRMVHTRVVDSAILTKNAVGSDCNRSWSLKTLSRALLGLEIQNGKGGHDCLEDTMATREVVLECNRDPLKLKAWADRERILILEEKEKRELEKKNKENGSGGQKTCIGSKAKTGVLINL